MANPRYVSIPNSTPFPPIKPPHTHTHTKQSPLLDINPPPPPNNGPYSSHQSTPTPETTVPTPRTTPNTPHSSQQSLGEGGGEKRFQDRHQRIGHFKKGDIIAVPADAPHWFYNNADEDLVVAVMQDNANQLDRNPRSFFLARNPQGTQEKHQRYREEHGGSTRGRDEFGNMKYRPTGLSVFPGFSPFNPVRTSF
ncbi:hypothetical protein F511_14338 [Dorcoceras hygrometricum]|uniref:Cupin type-1 domain-containing protein n=1 Tax=Dorcoceras hygrometricum TaxID=472368 RepID=A0A2Z7C520_9LAMI|nr:hypothetical protein F511_14338 [Dorcoceras hygrometricum]